MSNDLISRQEVIQAIGNERVWVDENIQNPQHHYHMMNEATRILSIIGNLPSVQPKTGQWVEIMVGDMPAQACNQCKTFYPLAYTGGGHQYCPNCGAKMESEERNEW